MKSGRIWNNLITKLKEFRSGFLSNSQEEDGPGLTRREKIIVFGFAYIIALVLWFLVNLSRPFTLTVKIPILLGQLPPNKSLSAPLPKDAVVNFSGEGWKLINLYHNPPPVRIDPVEGEMNFYDIVREQMNMFAGVNVIKVQPSVVSIHLENKVTKKVPIIANVEVDTKSQYDMVGKPLIYPDSVIISGAKSIVYNIDSWNTKQRQLKDVKANINIEVPLQEPINILHINISKIHYQAQVEEFTEGEARIGIETTNLPKGRQVTYNPSLITVKYDVPINEYERAQNSTLFKAMVSYRDIVRDSTGFVTPVIKENDNDLHIKLRSFQPTKLAYYTVLSSEYP